VDRRSLETRRVIRLATRILVTLYETTSLSQQLLIIIIIIIIIIISYFMQNIYNYIPAINHVSRTCNIAAILWLQFTVKVQVNFTLEQATMAQRGSTGIALLFL